MKTFTEGGRGKKQCISCKTFVGVRTKFCVCGHEFKAGEVTKPAFEPIAKTEQWNAYIIALGYNFNRFILTPNGNSGVTPNSLEYEDIVNWCEEVVAVGIYDRYGELFAPEALKYFTREFVNVNSQEYNDVSQHIDRWVKERING